MFAERLDASARSLTFQLERGPQRISEETIANFGKLISEQLRGGNPALRKAYVRLLIDNVRVDNQTIHIQGSKAALESAAVRNGDAAISMLPGFDRKWCRLQDTDLSDKNRRKPPLFLRRPHRLVQSDVTSGEN